MSSTAFEKRNIRSTKAMNGEVGFGGSCLREILMNHKHR